MVARLETLSWAQVRHSVLAVNPELVRLIDEISPSGEYTLYRIKYGFGDDILKDGNLQIPSEDGNLVSLSDIQNSQLKDDLGYNFGANPVGLVLKNSAELFLRREERIVPFALVTPGNIFGLWRLLDRTPSSHCPFVHMWGISAGARSLFMLPKISDAIGNNRLQKQYQLGTSAAPNSLKDHWNIFKNIATHSKTEEPWQAELLFFSRQWFLSFDDPVWKNFHRYLLELAWNSSGFWRNQFVWQLIFSIIQNKRRLKNHAYISDLVQHIFMVGVGALPGFAPAMNDIAGPITQIKEAYVNGYNLRKYSPLIMQPSCFSNDALIEPIYLSLQHPTAMELAPKFSTRLNALADLNRMQELVNQYMAMLADNTFQISSTPLSGLPYDLQFDYFHSEPNSYHLIRKSTDIVLDDQRFLPESNGNQCEFPADSTFFKGCIRISKKRTY